MTVNPLSAGNNYVSQVQPQPQTQVDRVAEQENEKKREEAKKAAATSVPIEPTVNTNGQKVGSVINVKA
ncbi:MAG: hypothetical protein WAW02_04640 [Sideroxyarcus sp.]